MAIGDEIPDTIRHYLDRMRQVVERVAAAGDADRMLAQRLAPDMFDTGFQIAVAMGFAARTLGPPAGLAMPEEPEEGGVPALRAFGADIATRIAGIRGADLTRTVSHRAGEADLVQQPADYVTRFGLPNMIFHMALAHGGLRQAGLALGKADFDGLHIYGR
ncbi:DUF1993 domain-containing protein [Jannaschia sp. S6380]|uniref:DUF1993 family protein n=1 Tax=Jannaschia sp. S6380 TaxID=2926408 RepID=UPI001FF2F0FF|nr:DUF1993 family protein [Jannaschia sp. S6380]MCK0168915.1 DUF1993 domain-containing protein [Jannaschia sp. S6380]